MKWVILTVTIVFLCTTHAVFKRLLFSESRRTLVLEASMIVAALIVGLYVDYVAHSHASFAERPVWLDLIVTYTMWFNYFSVRKKLKNKDYPCYDNLIPMLDVCLYGLTIALCFIWLGLLANNVYIQYIK